MYALTKFSNEKILQDAIEAHQSGNLQEAERLYRLILQAHPQHPDVNHNLGMLAVSLNKLQIALPYLKIALEANPKHGQFWVSYIDVLFKFKQYDTARKGLIQEDQIGLFGNWVSH